MLTKKQQQNLAHRKQVAELNVRQALTGFEQAARSLESAAAERRAIATELADEATALYQAALDSQQESTSLGVLAGEDEAKAKKIRELFL